MSLTAGGRGGGGFSSDYHKYEPQLFSYKTKGIQNQRNFLFLSNIIPFLLIIIIALVVATAK